MGDPTGQVHDFEPGIAPSGLFWTIPLTERAFDAEPGRGRARFTAADLAIPDFHDFANAVSPAPASVPGHTSFNVDWTPNGAPTRIRDAIFGFAGRYVPSSVTIEFAVSDDGTGVVYRSDDDGQVTVSGGVGHERNGVFFDRHDSDDDEPGARLESASRWSQPQSR